MEHSKQTVINEEERVGNRIKAVKKESEDIIEKAMANNEISFGGNISFRYQSSAPMDILTTFERAQSVFFVSRYEHLPEVGKLDLIKHNEKLHLGSMPAIRYLLNEYRTIIMNQEDSIYYENIHKFCSNKLANKDPKIGLSITVMHEQKGDVTDAFREVLKGRRNGIKEIIKNSDFNYIYNGILQHTGHKHTDRFLKDYHSGEINYIFLKHAFLLEHFKEVLNWHYRIVRTLTFPKLGPL